MRKLEETETETTKQLERKEDPQAEIELFSTELEGDRNDDMETTYSYTQETLEDESVPCVTSIDRELEERERIEKEVKEQEEGRITLDVGGRHFAASRTTLLKDKSSIFHIMLEDGKKHYFIDRDGAHFRYILNYLRQGCLTSLAVLPRENRYLLELKNECVFYKVFGLEKLCEHRLALYRSLGLAF